METQSLFHMPVLDCMVHVLQNVLVDSESMWQVDCNERKRYQGGIQASKLSLATCPRCQSMKLHETMSTKSLIESRR